MKKPSKTKISNIFKRLSEANPNPQTELDYNSHFELLISVILSAQATDISVNKATKKLYAKANTPQQIYALGEDKLKIFIQQIGLYNTKAKNIILCCQRLIEVYQGKVPNTRKDLESLAGVGRKTANVVLNTAFGQKTMAVDTHIFRISRRIGFSDGKTVRAVEDDLMQIIPLKYQQDAHHWLILHGRYICKARKPDCDHCLINDLCQQLLN